MGSLLHNRRLCAVLLKPPPPWKAVSKVKNKNDGFCFLYSVLAHIHTIHWEVNTCIECLITRLFYMNSIIPASHFRLKIRQIRKFEDQNPHVSINVLYHDSETSTIMPLRVTKHRNRLQHVNLFLLYDDSVNGAENAPTDTTNVTELFSR